MTHYHYDPYGRRVARSRSGQTDDDVYGIDANPVAAISGADSTRYIFGPAVDQPLAMQRAGQSTYFEQDALSSVTSLTDSSGSVVGRYSYDTYGRTVASSGSITSPFTFAGRPYDTGVGGYDNRARWYDPSTGRFLSRDPIPTINPYPYVSGAPTNLVDPSGAEGDLGELLSSTQVQTALGASISSASYLYHCAGTPDFNAGHLVYAGIGGALGSFVGGKLFKAFEWAGTKAFSSVAGGVANSVLTAAYFVAGGISGALTVAVADAYYSDEVDGHVVVDPTATGVGGAVSGAAGVRDGWEFGEKVFGELTKIVEPAAVGLIVEVVRSDYEC